VRHLFFVLGLSILVSVQNAAAARHLTDINGHDVVIQRGSSLMAAKRVAGSARHPRTNANVTINAGADVDAANNDYRRIQDALNAATSGDTITLSGTFDFTQPFAAAAWALGNDNTASTGDEYEVLVPTGLSNVTLTATSLGAATIQGPGDLPTVDLESFLIFDASVSGASTGWTISNLRILDFDLSIGMFAVAVSDYNDTTIQNNFIRIPVDLNATVAPGDSFQNIGIHFSFGTGQSITGNTIEIPGNGLSDSGAGKFSSIVGMQSNTSGGAVYNGLTISNNTIHVLNAQSADPEKELGIWENAHGHTSNISVTGNSFLNDAAGNDPSLNLQSAFRVTSHSGLASTVTYSNNTMSGANIGFQWITGSNFTGNQAVVLTGNTITNCDTGVLVQSNGIAHIDHSLITSSGSGAGIHLLTGTLTGSGADTNSVSATFVTGGSGDGIWIEATAGAVAPISDNNLSGNSGFGLRNDSVPLILAELNFWGSNLAAPVAAEVSGNADFDPWLASGTDVSGLFGFQPFSYATTSGTLTTFLGTSSADVGALLAGDPLELQMDGDIGFVPLAEMLSLDIQLLGSSDLFTLGQTAVPTTFDAGPGTDTLIVGSNVPQTWNITSANGGSIPGAASTFAATENLQGGAASDSFVFGAAGSLAGSIDGSLGLDSLDNSAIPAATVNITGPGSLDSFAGTATGLGAGFDNIGLLVGSPADLSVTKTGPATVSTGAPISYMITVTNSGPNAALGAGLEDILPAGATFVSLTKPVAWSCSTPIVGASGTVTCTLASMPVGADVFTLVVNAPATPGNVDNTATVSSANEGAAGDESSTATTTAIGTADLSITKTGPSTIFTGLQFTYDITVSNDGPDAATNATVTDVLPAGVTFVSAVPSQGTCSGTTTITCNLGTINSGATATIALTVLPTATLGTISNTATVESVETDPTPANTASTSARLSAANIPTVSLWALLAMIAMLGALAVKKM